MNVKLHVTRVSLGRLGARWSLLGCFSSYRLCAWRGLVCPVRIEKGLLPDSIKSYLSLLESVTSPPALRDPQRYDISHHSICLLSRYYTTMASSAISRERSISEPPSSSLFFIVPEEQNQRQNAVVASFNPPTIVNGSRAFKMTTSSDETGASKSRSSHADLEDSPVYSGPDDGRHSSTATLVTPAASRELQYEPCWTVWTPYPTQQVYSNFQPIDDILALSQMRYTWEKAQYLRVTLLTCCNEGSTERLHRLFYWANLSGWSPTIMTWQAEMVHHACVSGQTITLDYLKQRGILKSVRWSEIIPITILNNRPNVLRWWLQRGLSPNADLGQEVGPLMWAIRLNTPDIVQELLDAGCNEHRRQFNHPYHKHMAVAVSMPRALDLCGALLRYPPGDHRNATIRETGALELAAARGDLDLVNLLVPHAAIRVNNTDIPRLWNFVNGHNGSVELHPALHEAVSHGHGPVVARLLQAGASMGYRDRINRDAWDYARTRSAVDGGRILRMLEQQMSSRFQKNQTDGSGRIESETKAGPALRCNARVKGKNSSPCRRLQ